MNIKKILQYTFFAILGVLLLRTTYRDISFHELVELGKKIKVQWVFLAIGAHLINHFFRALRWRLLLRSQGYEITRKNAFLGEMSGFCLNLIPPRIGEWMRCVILKRLEGVPVSKSLGAVLVERVIEFFLFMSLLCTSLGLEFLSGSGTLGHMKRQIGGALASALAGIGASRNIILIASFVAVAVGVLFFYWQRKLFEVVWDKVKHFFQEVFEGIREMRKSNSFALWGISLAIIFFHFMVEYLSFFAIEEIQITWKGALLVFVIMNIGMSAPTPGGVGVYHLGVISTLLAMGVEKKYAVLYATITHTVQLFNALVVGGSSFLIANLLPEHKEQKPSTAKTSTAAGSKL